MNIEKHSNRPETPELIEQAWAENEQYDADLATLGHYRGVIETAQAASVLDVQSSGHGVVMSPVVLDPAGPGRVIKVKVSRAHGHVRALR